MAILQIADAQLCQRIACGAVSQAEAGLLAVYECSRDGYVGVDPCSHPDCLPYMPELQAKGICGGGMDVAEVLPLHPVTQPDVTEVLPLHPVTQPDVTEVLPLHPVTQPDVTEVLPLHPVTQPDDGEQPGPPVPVNLPAGEMTAWRTPYCRAMEWVSGNPCMAAACIVAGWWFLTREER